MALITVEKFLNSSSADLESMPMTDFGYDGSQESLDKISLIHQWHKQYHRKNIDKSIQQSIHNCLEQLFTSMQYTEDINYTTSELFLDLANSNEVCPPAIEAKYPVAIEELSEKTGYSIGTIQDFVYQGIVPKPRQLVRTTNGVCSRKGYYTKESLSLLNHYKHLMTTGRPKAWVIARMIERRTELCQ